MRTYPIGAFARFTQTPVKTLRHYDALGLLRPARVDPETGYRYYTAAQVERLNRILVLKDLGLSLREIRTLLAGDVAPEALRAMLERQQAELARVVATERARLARAGARLHLLEAAIAVRTTPPQLVAGLRATLRTHDDCAALFADLDARGARGQRAAIWHACRDGAIDCEALVFLGRPIASRGRIRVYELPARRVASLVYRDGDDFMPAYRAIRAWLAATRTKVTGPKRELMLSDSLTELQFPIAREAA